MVSPSHGTDSDFESDDVSSSSASPDCASLISMRGQGSDLEVSDTLDLGVENYEDVAFANPFDLAFKSSDINLDDSELEQFLLDVLSE